ncbi:MAG: NAD-dependent deacylase [Fibrobacterota bacterium]
MMPSTPTDLLERLRAAKFVVALTGAGISAESGVPTFRDAQTGLWARYSPEDLATPQAFQRNPRMVWEWYRWRRQLVLEAEPGSGHAALVELSRRFDNFRLITQNVDGLHQRAGSTGVVELHGNLFRNLCAREGNEVEIDPEDLAIPPRCPQCGGPVRPGVVWFGEALAPSVLDAASQACQEADLVLVVGTSGMVHPAASLPALAKSAGAYVVEINPEPTPLSDLMDLSLREKAGPALVALLEALA